MSKVKNNKNNKSEDEPQPFITFTETINPSKILDLLRSGIQMDERSVQLMMESIQHNGTQEIGYYPSEKDTEGVGRLYTKHGVQMMKRHLRDYLLCDDYIDIDVVNCSPTFMSELLVQNGKSNKYINCYIQNRDQILKQLNMTKKDVLSALFNDDYTFGSLDKDQTIKALYNEVRQLITDKEDVGSKLALLTQRHERSLMQNIIHNLKCKGVDIFCWLFDGLVVHKRFLPTINIFIEQHNKISPYKLVIKPWRPVILPPKTKKIHNVVQPLYNCFDFDDPFVFDDNKALESVIYSSIGSVFYHNYRNLLRSVRLVHCDNEFIFKCTDRKFKIASKCGVLYRYKRGNIIAKATLKEVLQYCSELFAVQSYSHYPTDSPNIFSVFPNFLAKRVDYDIKLLEPIFFHIDVVWVRKPKRNTP
jgi:hypothetical protein